MEKRIELFNDMEVSVIVGGVSLSNVALLGYLSKMMDFMIKAKRDIPKPYIYSFMELLDSTIRRNYEVESDAINDMNNCINVLDMARWSVDAFESEDEKKVLTKLKSYVDFIFNDFKRASEALEDNVRTPFYNIELLEKGFAPELMDHELELLYYAAVMNGFEPGPGCAGHSNITNMSRVFEEENVFTEETYVTLFNTPEATDKFIEFCKSELNPLRVSEDAIMHTKGAMNLDNVIIQLPIKFGVDINIMITKYEGISSIRFGGRVKSTLKTTDYEGTIECIKSYKVMKDATIARMVQLIELFGEFSKQK